MPAASLSYSSPQVYTVGVAHAPLTPTMVGSLSAFTVSPGLPAGLALDAISGVISGTPTAAAPQATYTISAASSSGSVMASVSITVNTAAPASIDYGAPAFTFTVGVAARTLTPKVTGGPVSSWSISPALPAALTFSATDGHIAGTATAASAAAVYVITGVGDGGSASVRLTIEVDSDVLVELGHVNGLTLVRFSGSRVISLDSGGHWVLWDYAAAAILARGDTGCISGGQISNDCGRSPLVDVAGPTAVIRTLSGFEVYSSSTGQLLSTITATAVWWKLANDGSYIGAGSPTGLTAWSPAGQLLLSRPGDYRSANAFAAPGAVRVAAGPAGAVVETVTIPGATVSTSPAYNGQFSSWFLDGNRFVTVAGATALVYSLAAVQQAAVPVPASASVTGQGNYIWTFPDFGATLNVYAVGPGTTPVASYAIGSDVPIASATTIGVLQEGRGLSVIDLSDAAPVKVDYTLPVVNSINLTGPPTYAATSASQWVLGTQRGVLLDGASLSGTPRYLALGDVSIAGSNGRIAIATASGSIRYFNADTLVEEGVIQYSSSKVLLSSDGTLLAAEGDTLDYQYAADWSLKIYTLPSGTPLFTWPYPVSGNTTPQDIDLSGSGTVLGQVLFTNPGGGALPFYTQQAGPPTGGSLIFSTMFTSGTVAPAPPAVRISPDGTLIAAQTDPAGSGTNILQNGAFVTAVSGWPVGWIDNTRLLMSLVQPLESIGTIVPGWCAIVGTSGQSVGSCPLPELYQFQTVTSDSIYSPDLNSVVSLSTGAITWSSGNPHLAPNQAQQQGALAGARAVFVSGTTVVAQSLH